MRVDSDEINLASIRLAKNKAPKECTFHLYRLGTSFALVVYNNNKGNSLPETAVDSLVASSTASIFVKDGKYLEDLPIKGILKGVKLGSINPADFRARITYRNNIEKNAPVKVNAVSVNQTKTKDSTIPGYSYCHSFVIDNVADSALMSANGEFDFTLNIKGVETSSFPSGFLIEFYNKIDNDRIPSYNYTEFYKVIEIESASLALKSDKSNLADEVENLFIYNPVFTITSSFEFSDKDKAKIANAISVSDFDSEKLTTNWEGKVLTLSFSEALTPNKEYTISMADVKDLENAVITPFKDFKFTTISETNDYYVVHQQENIKDDQYTEVETETFNAKNGTKVTPDVKSYEGFISPAVQTMTINPETTNKIVYKYKRKVSTVTVNKGDGIESVSGGGDYKYGATVTVDYILKDGQTFSGWTGDKTESSFTMPDSDVTMTANANLDSFTITFDLNDGNADNPTCFSITSDTFTLNNPTKEGLDFIGWEGTGIEEGVASMTVIIPHGSTGSRSYKALYTPKYPITYELDGGIFETEYPTSYNIYSNNITLVNPTKAEYDFMGWEGDGIAEGTASMAVTIPHGSTGPRNYTASYTPKYTIVCDLCGGEVVTANPTSYNIYSDEITLNNPTRADYDFLGWEGDGIDEGTASMTVTISHGSTGNKHFVASYTSRYTITYFLDDGEVETANPTSYNIYSDEITLNNPTKADYDFLGWLGTDIDKGTASMTVTIPRGSTKNRSYIASFTQRYSITYVLNGGEPEEENPTNYNMCSDTITLKNPTKAGTYFIGWSCDEIVGASMTMQIPRGSTGNRIFTANWGEERTFTLPGDVTLVLCKCPAGTFMMGSPENEIGRGNEELLHPVTLTQEFYIGKFEITQEQYYAIMQNNPSGFSGETDSLSRPVEKVNYQNTINFCASLTNYLTETGSLPEDYVFDIPTEAQWEYACRAGTITSFNNGENIPDESQIIENCDNLFNIAWYSSISQSRTHTVGEKEPNNWGLYDMLGNVYEWCLDRYKDDYYSTPQDAQGWVDPTGPTSAMNRCVRGGCYHSRPQSCRSAYRYSYSKTTTKDFLGFRIILRKAL